MRLAILSRSAQLYSTRRLLEAALERGHEAEVIDHTRCYVDIRSGPAASAVHFGGRELSGFEAVIPRIGHSVTQYGAAILRQFESQGVFCLVSSIALVRARDKLRSYQLLAREKVAIPNTAFARHPSDIDDVLALVGGPPVIIKTLQGTQGVGVVIAETKKAAKSVMQAFYGLKADILVQEFIREAKGADLRAIVVGNRVVAAMRRQGLEEEFRANVHQGGSVEMVRLSVRERRMAVKAARSLGLGVAGVDLLQSERGPLVLEVNASPGLEGIERATGIDVAGAILEYVEEHTPKRRRRDRVGA